MMTGSLTLDLGDVLLKKDDTMEFGVILLPWGAKNSTNDSNVRNVREDSVINPYRAEAIKGNVISNDFFPSVRAISENGETTAEFKVSGGTNMAIVRVYGFSSYSKPKILVYDEQNGQYKDYITNTTDYNGYSVFTDEDGTYSFVFAFDMTKETPKQFKVVQ